MVNRREFFGRFLKSRSRAPAQRRNREQRYRELETFLVVDVIPYDVPLSARQERDLRSRARDLLERTGDDELFSSMVVARLDALGSGFVAEIGAAARFDTN